MLWYEWLLWGVLIAIQNAMFTWTSRARNSDKILQHAIAIPIAQCVYFLCSLFALDNGIKVVREGNYAAGAAQLLLYMFCTSVGSLSSHWIALRHKKLKTKVRSSQERLKDDLVSIGFLRIGKPSRELQRVSVGSSKDA